MVVLCNQELQQLGYWRHVLVKLGMCTRKPAAPFQSPEEWKLARYCRQLYRCGSCACTSQQSSCRYGLSTSCAVPLAVGIITTQ